MNGNIDNAQGGYYNFIISDEVKKNINGRIESDTQVGCFILMKYNF